MFVLIYVIRLMNLFVVLNICLTQTKFFKGTSIDWLGDKPDSAFLFLFVVLANWFEVLRPTQSWCCILMNLCKCVVLRSIDWHEVHCVCFLAELLTLLSVPSSFLIDWSKCTFTIKFKFPWFCFGIINWLSTCNNLKLFLKVLMQTLLWFLLIRFW